MKLMQKLLKKYAFALERLVTDDSRSYASGARDLGIEHRHDGAEGVTPVGLCADGLHGLRGRTPDDTRHVANPKLE
jgi:hypothetical protein